MKEGWTYKKLGEVSSFQNGFAFKSSLFRKDGLPIVRISSIQEEQIKEDDLVTFYPSDYDVNFDNYKILPNDIVIAMSGGTTGKIGINRINKVFYQNQRVGVIRENKHFLNHLFLYYYLHTKSEESLKIAAGAAQPNLSTAQIKNFNIPLPPLVEQERIVSRLDAAFSHIDELKANAEKQLSAARDLFQNGLSKAMEPKDGWEEKPLGVVCTYHKEQGNFKDLNYIGMEHIESGTGKILGYMSSNDVLSSSFRFKRGEVLYGRLRPYLKKVYIAEFDGCCSTEVFPIKSDLIESGFLKYWFLTEEITNKINATSAGCRMPRGNMNEVKQFPFFFPNRTEQKRIVERLDALSEHVRELEELQKKIIAECDAMKQALLRKVFE